MSYLEENDFSEQNTVSGVNCVPQSGHFAE